MARLVVGLVLVALFAGLIAVTVTATQDSVVCDVVAWWDEAHFKVITIHHCNHENAVRNTDACVLWKTTTENADNGDIYIDHWYMCDEYQALLPMVVR